jgi:alpha-glucosidase
MIGGGSWAHNVDPDFKMDEELFVRMAEASALMPMMQFSWAPWRVLSPEAQAMVKAAADLHRRMAGEILALVRDAEVRGEPIVRSLEYNDPHKGYEHIMDEFMLGEDILVAAQTDNAYARPLSTYTYDYARYIKILGIRFETPETNLCFDRLMNEESL